MLAGVIGLLVGAALGVATLGGVGAIVGGTIGGAMGYLGAAVSRRRAAPRLATSVAVAIRTEPPLFAEGTNLSLGGMRLSANAALAEGTDIEIEFQLVSGTGATDERLCTRCVVVWLVPAVRQGAFDIGVLFTSLTADQRQLLRRYLADPRVG